MKKLLIVLGAAVLVFSGCFFDTGDWDGEFEGEQYYELDVSQNGAKLIVSVSVDSVLLDEYKADLGDEPFVVPEELFFWMSPKFKDRDDENMYPVARKRLQAGQLFTEEGAAVVGGTVTVSVDLADLARDWNIGWLDEAKFDDTETGYGDDMNGCYLFMSDGYREYWNYEMVEVEDGRSFYFQNSRPSGNGYSNLRGYPDTNLNEEWAVVSLLGSGLYVSPNEVLAGEYFYITLQREENMGPFDRLYGGFADILYDRGGIYLNESTAI